MAYVNNNLITNPEDEENKTTATSAVGASGPQNVQAQTPVGTTTTAPVTTSAGVGGAGGGKTTGVAALPQPTAPTGGGGSSAAQPATGNVSSNGFNQVQESTPSTSGTFTNL